MKLKKKKKKKEPKNRDFVEEGAARYIEIRNRFQSQQRVSLKLGKSCLFQCDLKVDKPFFNMDHQG